MTLESRSNRQENSAENKIREGEVPLLEILENRYVDVVVLGPVGRVDQETSEAFQARLLEVIEAEDSGEGVVLDFSGVEYISSVGLRAIMIGSKQSKAAERRLVVASLTPTVKEVFEISRFHHVIDAFESLREAIASISEPAAAAFDGQ